MEVINKNKVSLGLDSFDVLGFNSEEELNKAISKLIQVRSEFESESDNESKIK